MLTSLIIALCLSTTLTATTSFKSSTECSKYCEDCYYDGVQRLYICEQCLRRKFINSQECSSQLAPASDHCIIYIGYNNGQCGICEDGYLFQALNTTGRNWACVKALTPNCLGGTVAISPNNTHTAATETCTE